MLTLSYGFKKPQTGDNGSVFFPALEDNITQLNDHTHNGTNSSRITIGSITATTQSIASGSWSLVSAGIWRQLVTIPGGLQYDDVVISFRNSSTGDYIYPTVEKASGTTYYVYTNDNSLTYKAYYGA